VKFASVASLERLARLSVARLKGGASSMHRLAVALVRADGRPHDLAAAVLFAMLVVLVAFTFRDYAISNDEEVQQQYGELIVAYYASGFADQSVFHFKNLYLYGGLFDLLAVGLQSILPLDAYAVRHLLCGLIGVGGILAAWATARAIGGARAGLFAALALVTCGVWYGAMFDHTKDIPFAAAMMGALYFLIRIGRELPRPRWQPVLLFGVLCGFALGMRVLGVFVLCYAGLLVIAYSLIRPPGPGLGFLAFAGRSALALVPAFVIAYMIMIAAWPWAALAPLNPLRAIAAFDNFQYPIQTILAGHVYRMADVPRWYVPAYVGIKLSLPLIAGACLSLFLGALPRHAATPVAEGRRRELAVVALAALLPLICCVIVHGPGFTGMRHFLFTVPPIAVLAGLGFDGALRRLQASHRVVAAAGLAVVLFCFSWDASILYRLHPDEYLFFNPIVGGLEGASRRYETDYWVNIMPEAVGDLEHFLDRTETPFGKSPIRRYLVGVCGERLSFEKEADARLQWTRDWAHADFFIAPTHMNCDRAIDGHIVATVERLGVLIGVVKDRRALVQRKLSYSGFKLFAGTD
jgi:Dolichyl-phosphate-mannose-protein mannosyltransferase